MNFQPTVWFSASMNGAPSNSNPYTASIGRRCGIQNGFELPTVAWRVPNSFSDSTMCTAIALREPSISAKECPIFSPPFNAYDVPTQRRNGSTSLWIISHTTSTRNSWRFSQHTTLRPSGLQRMHLGSTSLSLTSAQSRSMRSRVLMTGIIMYGVFASTATSDCATENTDHNDAHSQKCSIINLEWH